MKRYSNEERAFKLIKEYPIILDFTGCKYLDEIHYILKDKFGLPEYYGKNWDALWDCLDYLFYSKGEVLAYIKGLETLSKDLRDEIQIMLEVFLDVQKNTPNFVYTVLS